MDHGLTQAAVPLEFHCLLLKASELRARNILPVMAALDTLSYASFQRLPEMLRKYECGQQSKGRTEKATRGKQLQHRSGAVMRKHQFSATADERLSSPVSLSTSSLNPSHVQHDSRCAPPPGDWERQPQSTQSNTGKCNNTIYTNPTTPNQRHRLNNSSQTIPNQQQPRNTRTATPTQLHQPNTTTPTTPQQQKSKCTDSSSPA